MENFNDMYSNIYITKIEIEPLKSEFLKEFFIVKKDLVIDKIQKMAEAYLEKERTNHVEEI